MDNQVVAIAHRIKELRQILGKTPEEMAAITNTTVEDYLRSENGENDFSFTFVHSCANAFGVDIAELIKGENAKLSGFTIVRQGEGLPLTRRRGFNYQHLASNFKGRISEPFVVTAKYEEEAQNKPVPLASHAGEEFDYILSGALKIDIDGHTDVLHAGDSVYYNSAKPHGMIATEGSDCTFIAIVIEALGRGAEYPDNTETRLPGNRVARTYLDCIDTVEDDKGSLLEISFRNKEHFNFAYDVLGAAAANTPDKVAMIHLDHEKKERRFTYAEVDRLSSKAANYLTSLGIQRGDRVMLVLKRHWYFWVAIMALCKMGAIVVPATHMLMKHDFVYRFNAAGIKAILCTPDGDVTHQVDLAAAESPTLEHRIVVGEERQGWEFFDAGYADCSESFPRTETTACGEDPMLMFFTSGTTSEPKMALHSHTYPLGHFITAKYWHNVDPNGIHFTISDTGWGKALWGKLYGQWMCGTCVFTYDFDRFDAGDIMPLFAQYGITTFCAPPTMFRMFIREDLSKYDLSSLKYANVAGEALNPEVYYQFLNATGIRLMEGFGQTETTLTVANLINMEPKPGSMGKPSPMYDIDIVDPDGNPVATGETGEIVVRVPDAAHKPCGLFLGYYNNDAPDGIDRELTDAVLHDGLYHTGDTAWRDEDGYFWYVGRIDDLIKSSGYRIGPFEIENVLMELPYVLECAVIGVPDPIRGQVVKAIIVLTRGTQASDELKKEIQTYVKTNTAPYKYPRIVEFAESLPKTTSGKIRRAELRKAK